MAEKSEKVMEMVQAELKKNPDAGTQELFEKAKKIEGSLSDLTLRQFHARYPLQVKRKMAASKPSASRSSSRKKKGKKASKKDGAARTAARQGLLRFAKDVAAAEDRADVIDVLTSVDSYVDDMLDAMGVDAS